MDLGAVRQRVSVGSCCAGSAGENGAGGFFLEGEAKYACCMKSILEKHPRI